MNIPYNWKNVDKSFNEALNIEETDKIKCLGSYVVGGENGGLVSLFNYVGYTEELLHQIDSTFQKINEENALIDGNPESEKYKSTALIECVYSEFKTLAGSNVYINISRMPNYATNKDYVFSFQIFVESKNGYVSAQITLNNLDDKAPLESALNNELVKQTMSLLNL